MTQDVSPGCTGPHVNAIESSQANPISPGVGCPESLMVHFRVGGTPGLHPGAFPAVPAGLGRFSNLYPGLTSWATLSRPYGTRFGEVSSHTPSKALIDVAFYGTAKGVPFV